MRLLNGWQSTLKGSIVGLGLLALIVGSVLLQGCSFSKFITGQKIEMFNLIIGDEEIPIQLPSEISKDKFGKINVENCWNINLCLMNYEYNVNDKPGFEHVNVWFSWVDEKIEIFSILWVSRDSAEEVKDKKAWLYDEKGFPNPSTEQDVNQIIERLYLGKVSEKQDDHTI